MCGLPKVYITLDPLMIKWIKGYRNEPFYWSLESDPGNKSRFGESTLVIGAVWPVTSLSSYIEGDRIPFPGVTFAKSVIDQARLFAIAWPLKLTFYICT